MKYRNPLAAAIVILAATALVVTYAYYRPEHAIAAIIIYIVTISLLTVAVYSALLFYRKHKSTIDVETFGSVTDDLNTEIVLWSTDFSFLYMNNRMKDLLGIPRKAQVTKEDVLRAFGVTDGNADVLEKMVGVTSYETSFKDTSGKLTTIAWSTSVVRKVKKRAAYLSAGFNMTELKKMKVNLASANDFFNSSMELAEIGVIMSSDRKKYAASSETVRMFGLTSSSIDVSEFRSLIHPVDRPQFDKALRSTDDSEDVRSLEMQIRSAKGGYRWYSFRYKSIKATDNTKPLFGGALMDINEEHQKDMLIERLAYNDEVTDIPNRNKLMTEGEERFALCKNKGYSYWIVVLDIDRFHIINDTCGYDNGNKILRDFAHLICEFTRDGFAARISGDNFALLLRDNGIDEAEPADTVKKIQLGLAQLAVGDLSPLNLSCSAGYSRMPGDGDSFLEVLEHAEFALKSASISQGSICAYEPSMHDSIIGSTELEKSLALAIDNDELRLFYQPKIDLNTGKIVGVEALIRWIKPDGTIIKPDAFVPIAESSHLIGRISEFVLNEGCRQNKEWQLMGLPNIVMSINFTSTDFYQKDLADKVREALIKAGDLQPEWLEVELTETIALSDIDFAVAQMNKLRDLGVKLAMDDFGTGYSSLSYLQILPITLLKLDRSFITNIQNDTIAYEIVSSAIRIARSKGIETIAEGIENAQQEEILRRAECDLGQGYLYGKPMPADQMQTFIEENVRKFGT
ncbi:MAG TPA: EAL domain-containing protein [Ruminococcus sp.]|nr:EAL domain-containing protein [Ruminococcus sp.]